MKTVLCDASPLIFLAKLDQLSLIRIILSEDVVVPKCVREEVLSTSAGVVERARLEAFLADTRKIDDPSPVVSSKSLSRCDLTTLGWAIEHRPDWLLADERLMRRVATDAGIAVVGFLGLLAEAAHRKLMPPAKVRSLVDDAITSHGLRISVSLYRRVMAEMAALE
jgi:predicted nucleic acid-binding protein